MAPSPERVDGNPATSAAGAGCTTPSTLTAACACARPVSSSLRSQQPTPHVRFEGGNSTPALAHRGRRATASTDRSKTAPFAMRRPTRCPEYREPQPTSVRASTGAGTKPTSDKRSAAIRNIRGPERFSSRQTTPRAWKLHIGSKSWRATWAPHFLTSPKGAGFSAHPHPYPRAVGSHPHLNRQNS